MKTNFLTSVCYNPFFMENERSVNSFIFFKDNEIICQTARGWFGNSNNNLESLSFDFEIKRAIKIDLNRKNAFYVSSKQECSKGTINVYIPANMVGLNFLGEKVDFKTEREIHYNTEVVINTFAVKRLVEYKDKQAIRSLDIERMQAISFFIDYRSENTKQGDIIDTIQEALKKEGITNLTSYDIERMQKVLNISIK